MAIATTPPVVESRDNAGHTGNALRNLLLNFNKFITDFYAAVIVPLTSQAVLVPSVPSIGTTVTLALSAGTIAVAGVPTLVAAQTGQAFGALGTIPASTWGLIAIERVAAGTTTFVSAAANYTTGYATEAAAIAALPAITAGKVRVGYITVLASASGWVAGTDALAGGTGGNPATTTNYYTTPSVFDTTQLTASQIGNLAKPSVTFTS